MHPKEFIKKLDDRKIVAAIAGAESRTSGEIRVYVSHKTRSDALAAAQKRFQKLGMHRTRHHNAVLIFIVPRTRSFAIVGDSGVHEKCGDDFWNQAVEEFGGDLRTLPVTEALVRAIQKVGDLLAEHFPADPGDRNELPDEILHD